MERRQSIGQAEGRHEFPQHRLPGRAPGDDAEPARRGGLATGGFRHADDRHPRQLPQGEKTRIAEAGQIHRVALSPMLREGVERRMAGDGCGSPARDVTRPEAACDGAQFRLVTELRTDMGGDEVGDMRAGVRVDQQDAHPSLRA